VTERSVAHATFVVERTYDAASARVFAAWADPATKARWFASLEEWGPDEFELDFRVGGREANRGGPKGGPSTPSTAATRTSWPTSASSTPTPLRAWRATGPPRRPSSSSSPAGRPRQPNLTVSLLGMGLVDELRVMVNPVALGDGKSLFRSSKQELGLKLLQTRTFRSGNVLLTYRPPRRAR
jgi:hypothetical protein